LISKKFEKEFVFESSVLAWIRIDQKCWIRIRKKSIRIHNLGGDESENGNNKKFSGSQSKKMDSDPQHWIAGTSDFFL
jgi:hypothetical protein